MDVLELRLPLEPALGNFLADLFESLADCLQLDFREHADFFEHGGVGNRSPDVVFPEAPVEGDRFGEGPEFRGRTAGEAAGAGDGRGLLPAFQTRMNLGRADWKVTRDRTGTEIFAIC